MFFITDNENNDIGYYIFVYSSLEQINKIISVDLKHYRPI